MGATSNKFVVADTLRLSAERALLIVARSDAPCRQMAPQRGFHASLGLVLAHPKDHQGEDHLARPVCSTNRLRNATRTNQSTFDRIDLRLSAQIGCLAVNIIANLRAASNTLFATPPDPPRHRMMGRDVTLSHTNLRRRSEEPLRWHGRDVSHQSLQPTYCHEHPMRSLNFRARGLRPF